MEQVTVNTLYTFVSDDGTDYSENRTYFSDADTEASRARRLRFVATVDGAAVITYGTVPASNVQLNGPGLLFLVNRNARADMFIKLDGSLGATEGRRLRAGQWIFLDVTDMGQQAYADPLNYIPENLNAVTARSEHSTGKGEYLSIYKVTS